MGSVSNFEAYQHRAKRLKLLEDIYQSASNFFTLNKQNLPISLALAILADKVELLKQYEQRTPPPKDLA